MKINRTATKFYGKLSQAIRGENASYFYFILQNFLMLSISNLLTFVKILSEMDTVVIKARTKADVRLLTDLSKRIGAEVINTDEWLEDKVLCRLIEEGLKEPSVSRDEIMQALKR